MGMAALVVVALGAAVYAPALLFFALPLLFGVPHVAADLRHLVLRRDLPASWRRQVWIGCAALLALRGLDALHASTRTSGVETLLAVGWALLAIRAGAERGVAVGRARWAVGVVLAVGLASLHEPRGARLLLLHAHNVLAVLAAGFVFRARSRACLAAALAIAGVALLLASGALFRVSLAASGSLQSIGLPVQLSEIAEQVAPGLRGDRAIGVASAFLFLQAVHYVIWLGLIPDRDGAGERSSSLRSDFGRWGLVAIAGASLAVMGAGFLQPRAARALYLSLAGFHVYLELVMLLYLWVARGAQQPARAEGLACCR